MRKLPKIRNLLLQYHTKEGSDEVDFLHAEEHEDLLQINTMVLIGMVEHSHIITISQSLQYLKQEGRDEVDFLHADKHQS